MRSEFELAFNEITELRSLPREVVLEALQTALVSAYRRDTGASAAQRVEADIDPATGRPRIFVEKEVVESVENPRTEVDLERARFYDPEAQLGDMVMVQVQRTTKKFGRIAAQTAKQVILQKIREAERNSLYEEFVEREGDLINGTVQSVNAHLVTLSLGRAEAIMPRVQQIPGERYRPHDKLRTYVLEVKRGSGGPQIIVSRSHRNMLRRLLEYEVPEIYNGQVEIKNIAREAGYRSKVAVAALQEGIDPVGACVGMRGMRIQNIVKELHDEKIDVIEWVNDQQIFIAKALSPARVNGVYLDDDPDTGRTAVVIVPDDQLSLAIGREGQNARLAAKLTGWRIDIKSVAEAVQDALSRLGVPPLAELTNTHPDLLNEIERIMEKRAANRTVMPEEFSTLAQFADLTERRSMSQRELKRKARQTEINAVKSTLPQGAFELGIDALDLPEAVVEALQPLENVGEIMWRFLLDEGSLHKLLARLPADSFAKLQSALDRVVIPEVVETLVEERTRTQAEAVEPGAEEETPIEASVAAPETTEVPEEVPTAFGDEVIEQFVETPEEAAASRAKPRKEEVAFEEVESEDDDDFDFEGPGTDAERKKKKDRQKRRQLVFDEKSGEVVARRRRKGGRTRDDWDDFLD
ncbi:MAG: transcription termination factor NusA [Anaerolineae bacterium]|nr:transcription termination factor NusA [Anaerolineae bacterium]